MEFNHIHPSYKNETEQKRIIKEKYEQIYLIYTSKAISHNSIKISAKHSFAQKFIVFDVKYQIFMLQEHFGKIRNTFLLNSH